jgi:hypothetical protein
MCIERQPDSDGFHYAAHVTKMRGWWKVAIAELFSGMQRRAFWTPTQSGTRIAHADEPLMIESSPPTPDDRPGIGLRGKN